MSSNGTVVGVADRAQRFWVEIEAPTVGRSGQSVPAANGRQVRPPIDVYETTDALVVKAYLPEAHPSDLDVTVGPTGLHIAGRLGWAGADDTYQVTWHRRELGTVRFAEAVALPVAVDADRAVATYEAGVLAILLPKTTQSTTKRIPVRVHQAVVDLG